MLQPVITTDHDEQRLRDLLVLVPSYAFAIFRAQQIYPPETAAFLSDVETLENCRREFAVKPEYDWRTREYLLRLQQAVDTMVSGLTSLSIKYQEKARSIDEEKNFRIREDANMQRAWRYLYGSVKIMALFGVTATLALQIPGVKEFWLAIHGALGGAAAQAHPAAQSRIGANVGMIAAFIFFCYLFMGSLAQILRRWGVGKLFNHAEKRVDELEKHLAVDSRNLVLEGYRHAQQAWRDFFHEDAACNATAEGYIDMMVRNLLYLRRGE